MEIACGIKDVSESVCNSKKAMVANGCAFDLIKKSKIELPFMTRIYVKTNTYA